MQYVEDATMFEKYMTYITIAQLVLCLLAALGKASYALPQRFQYISPSPTRR